MTNPSEAIFSCRVCAQGVSRSEAVACSRCSSPHHADCWDFIGGCSVFGCGCREKVPFESVEKGLQQTEVRLSPSLMNQEVMAFRWKKTLGWLRVAARSLPKTLGAGFVGSLITTIVVLRLGATSFLQVWTSLVATGLLHGLLAPLVAPSQIRHPGTVVILCGGLFPFLGWLLLGCVPDLVELVLAIVSLSILGSTVSEWCFGRRSRIQELIGRAAIALRYLGTGLFTTVALFVVIFMYFHGEILHFGRDFTVIAVFFLMSVCCAGHPLETGKKIIQDSFEPKEDRRAIDSGPSV